MPHFNDQTPALHRDHLEDLRSVSTSRLLWIKWLAWLFLFIALLLLPHLIFATEPDNDTPTQWQQAHHAYILGEFSQAKTILEVLSPSPQRNALLCEVHFAMAQIAYEQKESKAALSYIEKIFELDPEHPGGRSLLEQLRHQLQASFNHAYLLEALEPSQSKQIYQQLQETLTKCKASPYTASLLNKIKLRLNQL